MKAPLHWFLYLKYAPDGGDWKKALSTVKAGLSSAQRDEIESFLRAAQTADEDDLYIVESPELETALLIEITDGSSIRDVWADHLRDFLE